MKTRLSSIARMAKVLATGLIFAWVSGCSTVTQVGTMVGQATGVVSADQADSINKSAVAVEKTFQDITPEQEYYIGRAVTATVFTTYKPFDLEQANAYINLLGQAVAQCSPKPETFGGYHFLLLDSDDINAFAAPGGLITISRGMVRCCKSEDELVAVLAHEVSHVNLQHGLKAIKKGRLTTALTTLGLAAGSTLAGNDLAQITQAFEGSITDITSTMMNNGYARTTEYEADKGAVAIMRSLGYNPAALVAMLERMKSHLKPDGKDFAKTHPAPDVRIAEIKKLIGSATPPPSVQARQQRFEQAMNGV